MTPFEKAFAKARNEGLKEFTFKGKPYHTKTKGEVEAEAKLPLVSQNPSQNPFPLTRLWNWFKTH